jgi:hypothetical protein
LAVIRDFFSLLAQDCTPPVRDVRILSLLRFGAEVLVSTEYVCYWKRLQELGLSEDACTAAAAGPGHKVSLFYYPHIGHDAPTGPMTKTKDTTKHDASHADRLADRLKLSIEACGTGGVDHCLAVMNFSAHLKKRFYDQFVTAWLEQQTR